MTGLVFCLDCTAVCVASTTRVMLRGRRRGWDCGGGQVQSGVIPSSVDGCMEHGRCETRYDGCEIHVVIGVKPCRA
jgi:hypothetical protein